MSAPPATRRLAAVLAADVVGYSRLMGEDEAGTQRKMTDWIAQTVRPLITSHNGRIFKLMGDGVLAEFGSVVDAVQCALEWQRLPTPAFAVRIGVNLGDIIVEGDDIFGEGVNIAARLEAQADPGTICISDVVHGQIKNKVDVRMDDLGSLSLKNIADPVRTWQIAPEDDAAPTAAFELPEKPSIAVLPFDNMSTDPEYAFLADGISEDLITALSKVRWFFVIARNSTFTYKGQAVDIKRVGRELGVRYVMEGSVRKAGNRVRVTAQLIEAATGHHVWAERYDREIEDIFDLQDEMTQTIIGAVEPEISAVERAAVSSKAPETLDAWEIFQRGVFHMWSYSQEDHANALKFLTRASELDPNFGPAHAYRAYVHYQGVVMHWSDNFEASLREGMIAARKALAADPEMRLPSSPLVAST
ncbi:adenylate/guanylate cyclase domain-containing protein [Sulfitobacter aestuariivivens]|uniref:adenylate/guanylate cyclase domain-containing protein n=1 Tax=Sulfitobacter aestuariivivens TaxID=2766981 RepID=UPI0036212646